MHRVKHRGTVYNVLKVGAITFTLRTPGGYIMTVPQADCESIEGQEPFPLPGNSPDMQALVMMDLHERHNIGIDRYGQGLKAFDGRDALRDVYDELLDAAVYIRKCIYERDNADTKSR